MSLSASIIALALAATAAAPEPVADYRQRLAEDEIVYFLLPDRFENGDPKNDTGGLKGDRLITGYDPASKGFFHGGDIKGLINRLDYIQNLGATAIWLSPVFTNKAVQGPKGQESAGYHGYWVTDFTKVDPHLGTNGEFRALVDAAHKRGMKVYMDILINHTADVLEMAECNGYDCAYRSRADYPYSRKASDGSAVNAGFTGDEAMTRGKFLQADRPELRLQCESLRCGKEYQGSGLAERPYLLPQSGQFDLHRRKLDDGRFCWARRSDDRKPARRAGLYRNLWRLDRQISASTVSASIRPNM